MLPGSLLDDARQQGGYAARFSPKTLLAYRPTCHGILIGRKVTRLSAKRSLLFIGALLLGAFALAGCKAAVLGQVALTCDATGMADATFQWTPVGEANGIQYLDLSLNEAFPPGLFLGVGPLPYDQQTLSWKGLVPGSVHHWRVNTLVDGLWYPSATGTFTTPCVQERSEYGLAQGINQLRNDNGLASLSLDPELTKIANARALDMATRGYFSHDPPDGCNAGCLMAREGVRAMEWGEVIAWNTYRNVDERISVAISGWRNSPGHFAVITKPYFTDFGVGFALVGDTSFEVVVFAKER